MKHTFTVKGWANSGWTEEDWSLSVKDALLKHLLYPTEQEAQQDIDSFDHPSDKPVGTTAIVTIEIDDAI